ncbi:MAG: type IX secretion system membrane protein PorP/SprF, partial [Bacteroidota bacterium]
PQLLGFDLTYTNEAGEYNVQRVRHYYALTGTILRFRNDSFMELSAWGKYVEGAPFNADFNMRYQMNNALYLGTGLSTAGNFHVEAGVNLGPNSGLDNNIRIGYGADYSFSSFGPTVGGTHEIQISMAFDR